MKLLVISAAFPPMASGEAANTYYFCQHLSKTGLNVKLLTTFREEIEKVDGIELYPIMNRWSWRELPKFIRFLKCCRPDAILLMYLGGVYNYHPMITFAPTIAKRVLPGVKFVTRFDNPLSGARPECGSLANRALRKAMNQWVGKVGCHYSSGTLLRDSDRIIVLCEYHLMILKEQSHDIHKKVSLIPSSPNIQIVQDPTGDLRYQGRKSVSALEREFIVGYMGYVYPNKGVDTLLHAFERLVRREKNIRLLVLGGRIGVPDVDDVSFSYFDKMKALSEQLGISDKVKWMGYVPDADIPSYIYAPDIFVLPFDHGIHLNNSSFASLAAYGVPVIATRGKHIDAAFVHGENVLLCPPSDPDAIVEALEMIMNDPGTLTILRDGIRSMAHDWFSWDSAIERTLATLGCVL